MHRFWNCVPILQSIKVKGFFLRFLLMCVIVTFDHLFKLYSSNGQGKGTGGFDSWFKLQLLSWFYNYSPLIIGNGRTPAFDNFKAQGWTVRSHFPLSYPLLLGGQLHLWSLVFQRIAKDQWSLKIWHSVGMGKNEDCELSNLGLLLAGSMGVESLTLTREDVYYFFHVTS